MTDYAQLLLRFDQLLRDLESGKTLRTSFRQWEVELLADIACCTLGSDRKRILRRYQRAVHRSLEQGAIKPMTLSEYLVRSRRDRRQTAA